MKKGMRTTINTIANATRPRKRGSDLREERWVIPAGSGERLSVAVLVDASGTSTSGKIRSLCAAAVGLVSERGDLLSVEAVRFARAAAVRPPSFAVVAGYVATGFPLIVIALLFAGTVRYGAKPLVQLFEIHPGARDDRAHDQCRCGLRALAGFLGR